MRLTRLVNSVLLLILVATTVLIGGCATAINDSALKPILSADIVSQQAGKHASSAILLDARPRGRYAAGHIPGAVNLRLEDVAAGRTGVLGGFSTIIVYGQHPGSASAIGLAKRLMTLGYDGVQFYEGGVDQWSAQGRTLTRSTPARASR